MAGFEQKGRSLAEFERQTTPCEILRLVQHRDVGCTLPTLFHVHAHVDDHLLVATAKTAKDAFAKAIEWHVVGRLTDISISDDTRSYSIAEFASVIRRIGQSRLLALTIVVPFLGSLLLFNQAVVDVLTLSPELVRRWFHLTVENSADAARRLTLARLYYVYFGLTFLGIGSAFFVLFCPLEIKNDSTAIEYQTTEAPLVSKPKMTLISLS